MPDREFFEELKSQFEREITLKDRLDTKAWHLMRMSGTTITLLLATLVFISQLKLEPSFFGISLVLLVSAIIFSVLSMLAGLLTHFTRNYAYPISHEPFFDGQQINLRNINLFRRSNEAQFFGRMIEEYLFCIRENTHENTAKQRTISNGHFAFFIALIIIPFIITTLYVGILNSPEPFVFLPDIFGNFTGKS